MPHSTAHELPYSATHTYTADFYAPVDGVLQAGRYDAAFGCAAQRKTCYDTMTGTVTVSIYELSSTVAIEVENSVETLLQHETLKATLTSDTTTASNFKFELKPARGGSWRLQSGARSSDSFEPRITGHFDVRVTATISGHRIVSAPAQLVVQFPSDSAVGGDPSVRRFTKATWLDVLRLTNRTWRHEEGYWIRLNTCTTAAEHAAVTAAQSRAVRREPRASSC